MSEKMIVDIISADGPANSVVCDRLQVNVADDTGNNKGGSYGIHPGHAKAVLVLSDGEILAFKGQDQVFKQYFNGGIAYIDREKIKILI